MSLLDNMSACVDDNGDKIPSNKKECTSCEQKVDDGKNEKTSNNSVDVDLSGALHNLRQLNLRSGTTNNDNNNNDDELLFQDPPPREDCPICFLPMPHTSGHIVEMVYLTCCGKTICDGCSIAEDLEMEEGNIKALCSLCRVPISRSDEDHLKRFEKRMKLNDANAIFKIGIFYRDGVMGLPLDFNKTLKLWNKAVKLGSIDAHYNLAITYYNGEGGVEKDKKKAIEHWKLAAIGGHEGARHSLGLFEEYNNRNMDRAMKHYIIGARCGNGDSLKKVGEGYKSGHVAKDEYASTLRAYQVSVDEMKSEQRTKAAM